MATWNSSLNRTAFSATLHCLTGCAIGEVLGIVIGTALGWSNVATIGLAIVLALFLFADGYFQTSRSDALTDEPRTIIEAKT